MPTNYNYCARSPAIYHIRLAGHLDGEWSDWFGGLCISIQDDETVLTGPVLDQPALHGILKKICDLGLTLVALERVTPVAGDRVTR